VLAGRALIGVLFVYATIRIFDLVSRGTIGAALNLSYESCLFLVEFALGVVAPLVLLSVPKLRANPRVLYAGALLAVFGFVVNRLNVSITGFEGAQGGRYIPSFGEAGITLFLVALGFGGFALAVKYLNVFPASHEEAGHTVTGVSPEPTATVQYREVAPLQKV
jgi:Ni/Fe-hydrogenase subunit HybB-like protein